jgi:light-regulated signal transduction histidine kinase (bacteriophytochrome)
MPPANEAKLDPKSLSLFAHIPARVQCMSRLIDDLLRLSRIRQNELKLDTVDLAAMATEIARELAAAEPDRQVAFTAQPGPPVEGDTALLRIALENLLANAWKYTRHAARPSVTFGCRSDADGPVYFIRDNGAGFRAEEVGRLFRPFQRLHSLAEYPGTGVGLTIVARIIDKHAGRVWAEGAPNEGATFSFALWGDSNPPI